MEFFVDMGYNPFLGTGLLAGILAGVACGIVGPYVVTRQIVFLSGAIAHIAVGGLGAAVYLKSQFPDALAAMRPIHGALFAALLGAFVIGMVQHSARERLDTLIGAFWAIGMAFGLLLFKLTPGYQTDLLSYLFGNIVYVTRADVILILVLDGIIAMVVLLFHKRLFAVCLDEQHASLQGVNVFWVNLLLLILVALTVITLVQIVGLILVLALLTLPAATAGHLARRLPPMMLVATVLCIGLTTIPRIAVYGSPISPEPAIVLAAGAVYIVSVIVRGRMRGV